MTKHDLFTLRAHGDVAIVMVEVSELTCEITDALLVSLRERLDQGQPVRIVLDLLRVKFIDSLALGGLVVLLRRVRQNGGVLALTGLAGHCLKVMQVTGLQKAFDLHKDVPSALESMRVVS